MQIYDDINLVGLAIIAFAIASVTSDEEFQCKPRPGCHIGTCEPAPFASIEDLDRSEFPITCKSISTSTTQGRSQVPGSSELFLQILMRFSKDTDNLEKEIDILETKMSQDLLRTKSELESSISNLTHGSERFVREMDLFKNETYRKLRDSESALETSINNARRGAVVEVMTEIDLVKNQMSQDLLQTKSELESSMKNLTRGFERFVKESHTVRLLEQQVEYGKLREEYDASQKKWSQMFEKAESTMTENANKIKELTKAFEATRQENMKLKEVIEVIQAHKNLNSLKLNKTAEDKNGAKEAAVPVHAKKLKHLDEQILKLKSGLEEIMMDRKSNAIILKRLDKEISELKSGLREITLDRKSNAMILKSLDKEISELQSAITCDLKEFRDPEHYNATFCPDGKSVGSTCTIKCERGYRLNTNLSTWTASCNLKTGHSTFSAEWDFGNEPYCEELGCDRRDIRQDWNLNATLCPSRADVHSKCTVTCQRGYRLRDYRTKFTATCGLASTDSSIAKWRRERRCIAITCTRWPLGPHQEYSEQNCHGPHIVDSTCQVQCKTNYKFVNTSQKYIQGICRLNDGLFSASWDMPLVPECEAIRCARKYFWKTTYYTTVSCPSGMVVGSKCSFACRKGYKFSDNTTSRTTSCKLQENNRLHAEWDFTNIPDCEEIVCKSWGLKRHQILVAGVCLSPYRINAVCVVQCAEHFRFESSQQATILSRCIMNDDMMSASWTPIPDCTETCLHTTFISGTGGLIKSPGYPDYYENGTCYHWNVTAPTGKVIKIESPTSFDLEFTQDCRMDALILDGYGRFCGKSAFSTFATISNSLFATFTTNGNVTATGFSFRWSAVVVTCRQKEFKHPELFNATSCPNGSAPGAKCFINCKRGYTFDTKTAIWSTTCKLDERNNLQAEWDFENVPRCEAIKCARKAVLQEHYKTKFCPGGKSHGSVCSVACKKGYTFSILQATWKFPCELTPGSQPAAEWNVNKAPKCIPIIYERKNFTHPRRYYTTFCPTGKDMDSTCAIRCRRGYRFSPYSITWTVYPTLKPGSNALAEWDFNNVPECEEITCKKTDLAEDPHLNVTLCGDERSQGSRCTVECRKGYRFQGYTQQSTATCRVERGRPIAKWIALQPCVVIMCPPWKLRRNQQYVDKNCYGPQNVDSVCRVRCKSNFKFSTGLQNAVESKCILHEDKLFATWRPQPRTPDCEEILCETFELKRNMELVDEDCTKLRPVNSSCRVRCKANFRFESSENSTATVGCKLNANTISASWTPISNCTERCPKIYSISGKTTGVITSPGYPSYYENDACFTWKITVPDDKVIRIQPAAVFDLESTGNEECVFDALIFEGYGRFCGETTFASFATDSNSLFVTFTTDDSIRKAGFSFIWAAVGTPKPPDVQPAGADLHLG